MHKQLECFNKRMTHSKEPWRLKQVNEYPYGISNSTLRIWITTPPTTQALVVNLVEGYAGVSDTMYNVLDLKSGIRPQKIPTPNSQVAEDVLKQTEKVFEDVRMTTMQAYINYKAYYNKKPLLWNWKNNKMCTFYSPKQITGEVKYLHRFSRDWAIHWWQGLTK